MCTGKDLEAIFGDRLGVSTHFGKRCAQAKFAKLHPQARLSI